MLLTQPNEKRCHRMEETHVLTVPQCCPISGNPLPGSVLRIRYEPRHLILEVASLRAYVDSYKGGKGDIRSMEGMVQAITQDCANAVQAACYVRAELNIAPDQQMILECSAWNKSVEQDASNR
jgi:NADPH-dependent 7-cyano-7-deazaguanine reductase QueF